MHRPSLQFAQQIKPLASTRPGQVPRVVSDYAEDSESEEEQEMPVFCAVRGAAGAPPPPPASETQPNQHVPDVSPNQPHDDDMRMEEESSEEEEGKPDEGVAHDDVDHTAVGGQLVQMILQEEAAQKAAEESSEEFSSGDEWGGAEEFRRWQERELVRMKREYLEMLEYKRDMEKLAALRTQEATEAVLKKRERKQWKFLQKYYHIGSFFRDGGEWDVSQGTWDFDAATGNDWMDKTLLPKILQVKDFGKKSRVKHTHLTDVDTTYRKDEEGRRGGVI